MAAAHPSPDLAAKPDLLGAPLTGRQIFAAGIYALLIVWINLYICRELFTTQTAYMNSMQGFWASLAKRSAVSWLHSNWWPFWDCGLPADFTYAPLIPAIAAALSSLRGITADLAIQSVSGFFYCLAPLTLFLLAWAFTRAASGSFLAALFYSLTSPTQLIVPDAEFAWKHFWDARRLYVVAVWDDTPHLAALSILPLAILAFALALRKRRLPFYALTAALLALMTLASDFGPVEFGIGAICVLAAFHPKDYGRGIALAFAIGLFAYAMAAPFLPPSMIAAIHRSSLTGEDRWSMGSITGLAIIVLGWIILWWLLQRWRAGANLRFFTFFAYLTGSVPVLAAWLHRQFLPQPVRYKLELEFALALLLIFGFRPLFARLPSSLKAALIFLLLGFAGEQIAGHRTYAKAILQPKDLHQTIEYRAAAWAAANLPGVRVMFPGSIAKWADDFADIPQFSGSSWSMAYNPVQQRALAAVYNGGDTPEQDARASIDWLKAFGAGAVTISGPESPEYWKGFRHPTKFDGVLPVLWRDSDTTIYRVPQRSSSLAHVVNESAIATNDIRNYVAALDDASLPPAELRWSGRNHIDVRANLQFGQVVSIQVSYHPGWHAQAAGRPVQILRDGFGLMWLRPACSGPCDIQLDYDGGWELRLCRYLSFTAIFAVLLLFLGGRRSRRRPKTPPAATHQT